MLSLVVCLRSARVHDTLSREKQNQEIMIIAVWCYRVWWCVPIILALDMEAGGSEVQSHTTRSGDQLELHETVSQRTNIQRLGWILNEV